MIGCCPLWTQNTRTRRADDTHETFWGLIVSGTENPTAYRDNHAGSSKFFGYTCTSCVCVYINKETTTTPFVLRGRAASEKGNTVRVGGE